MTSIEEELQSGLSGRVLACPAGGKTTTFQLIDESGSGEPYAGLAYTTIDSEGMEYSGYLDATGTGTVKNHFAGPVALLFDQSYQGDEGLYKDLQARPHYPLKITELQVCAEKTRYLNHDASRRREKPASVGAANYFQVEVRHLVTHTSHLPPEVERHFTVSAGCAAIMGEHGKRGFAIPSRTHSVLEVRPLRALRPMLSTAPEFCVLNLYQLALMATLSYCSFGQQPNVPSADTRAVTFPLQPSMGNWFGDALGKFDELWKVDSSQTAAYYPLYEDVPYSSRMEIVPFDPALYSVNKPDAHGDIEHPGSVHFLDDIGQGDSTDTQAFITHNEEVILIAVRGTYELIADGLRDADAFQVSFEEGEGKVHRGFYQAAQKAYDFVVKYLEKFYAGQKLVICGHSLGGAVALLLAEMLRRRTEGYNIQLYTYGAPRAGDTSFVKGAESLVHYRMVNHNDPVPSVPGSWMNTKAEVLGSGLILGFANVLAGLSVFAVGITNVTGEAYEHHGTLRHALPVRFSNTEVSSVLWEPGCDTVTQHAACSMALEQRRGLPHRAPLLGQIFNASDHSIVGSYVPAAWAALRRWQEALEYKRPMLTTREYDWVETSLINITQQLRDTTREMRARPDAYVRAREPEMDAIYTEINKLNTTRERLKSIRFKHLKEADIYGSLADQPQVLAQSLTRWRHHPENLVEEQLAMSPDRLTEGLAMADGTRFPRPYSGDILDLFT
jgi:pimeloyl-ACP methyl ester carboxylesterase